MADDSGIDPRYAAQFQRGFDPAEHSPPPARRGPVRLEGGPPPTAPRVPDPPRMAPRLADDEAADAAVPTAVEESPTPTALTWWDWLLPGIGAALIVIALMLLWSFGTDINSFSGSGPNDEWGMFLQQARYMLPGPLLTAGMLAVVGGVVLQAVRPPR